MMALYHFSIKMKNSAREKVNVNAILNERANMIASNQRGNTPLFGSSTHVELRHVGSRARGNEESASIYYTILFVLRIKYLYAFNRKKKKESGGDGIKATEKKSLQPVRLWRQLCDCQLLTVCGLLSQLTSLSHIWFFKRTNEP